MSIKIKELETFDNWTIIDLSYNSINFIEQPELLRKQKKLEELQLDFNRNFKKDGNEQIFEHGTLQRMSCRGCGFTKIQNRHFTALPQIVSLNLSENQITAIDFDAFELNRNLRLLDVSDNKLKVLHPLTFNKLRNFEELRLSHNALELPKSRPFLKCDSMKRLTLDSCNLIYIYRETFNDMRAIERMSLNANLIESLPVDIFKINVKLERLFLESNRLKFFPVSILDYLPHLKELCVDRNAFANSQEFATFVKRYNEKKLRTTNCNSDIHFFVEFLFKADDSTVIPETTTTIIAEKVLLKEGISDFFLGSYLSTILLVQAVLIILLTLYYIKITKYDKLGSSGSGSDDDVNYANTILNDNDIYKVYKLDE